jgi:hypothetical protein
MKTPFEKAFSGKRCNMCAQESEGLECNSILNNFKVSGGYDSTPANGYGALDDMTDYEFSLCEYCLDYLFKQFLIAPKVYFIPSIAEEKFIPAEVRVEMSNHNYKEDFFTEYNRRASFRRGNIKK